MTAFSPFADRSSGYLTRAIDVAFGLVIVIKCKMMLQPIGLLALCPTIACYSWTLVTALPIHGISILAMTLKPYILPRQSAGFQLWSFGMGDEESNAGTASPRWNDCWDTRASPAFQCRFHPLRTLAAALRSERELNCVLTRHDAFGSRGPVGSGRTNRSARQCPKVHSRALRLGPRRNAPCIRAIPFRPANVLCRKRLRNSAQLY